MIDHIKIKALTHKIVALLEGDDFTPIQVEIIKQRYLSESKKVDIRRISRQFHKPMKHIKRDYEKAERKLYNLLKTDVEALS